MLKSGLFSSLYKNSNARLLTIIALVVISVGTLTAFVVESFSPAKASDCSANAIIQCGINGTNQLQEKYNQNAHGDLRDILNDYGIDGDNIDQMVMGLSHKNGDITVDGEVVATDGRSIGRQNLSYSWAIKIAGRTYYESDSTDVFLSSKLPTLVLMEDGEFVGGVILDCGNPITGEPIAPKPKPEKPKPEPEKPKPEKPKPEPKPDVSIEKTVDNKEHITTNINQLFTYEIVVKNTGDTDLKNVNVTDVAPTGVTLKSADRGTISGNAWSYTIPSLKVDESVTFTITAVVKEYVEGILKNTACVDAPGVPGKPDDCDDATVEVKEPSKIVVCELKSKKYPVSILEKDFDKTLHSTDPEDCQDEPETPAELPKTGLTKDILQLLGAGGLSTATVAYIISRRGMIV